MRFFVALFFCFSVLSCDVSGDYHKISGETMGTYYNITYHANKPPDQVKLLVDQMLVEINNAVSTYIPTSTISQFNTTKGNLEISDPHLHFIKNFRKSEDIYELTDGYFDPTVMPLVNYWGFGYTPHDMVTNVDSIKVDSIRNYVGFNAINYSIRDTDISFYDNAVQLDFSAIAKGYAVDQIGGLLGSLGAVDYMVEIGGEVVTAGLNPKGKAWTIGINTPDDHAALTDLIEYLSISGMGMASSGNYRNYHESDGIKYGHTINPKSGYPEKNELLAVTVIAPDCITADALATACMAMGFEKAQTLINNIDDVSACFFVGVSDGSIQKKYSNGFIQFVTAE